MPLFRVLYRSRAATRWRYADLTALLEAACARNERDGLTGLLCYTDGHFFQCLEGPRAAVGATLARIYRDPRHTDVVLLEARAADARAFPDWGMKLVPPGNGPGDRFLRLFAAALGDDVPGLVDGERLFAALTDAPQLVRPNRAGSPHG